MGSPDRDLEAWVPRLLRAARGLLRTQGPADRLDPAELKRLGREVQKLSMGLTRDRGLAGERYMDEPGMLAAYLLYWWPVSYAQVRRLLTELPPVTGNILDLGSGPAPATFAALDAGASRSLALDRSRASLGTAAKLAELARRDVKTSRWVPGEPLPSGKFQLIVVQHLLNELGHGAEGIEQRTTLARELLDHVAPGGTLLLVEPALRDTSRDLLQVRDKLVDDGIAVRAPCLYRGACQALDRPSDWCHAERDWSPPNVVLQLANAASLHKERLKMSYLALAPPGEPWANPPEGRVMRIVSERLQGKGRLRYMGCGPEGRRGMALQDKHVNDGNRHFVDLQRGEVVRLHGIEPKGDGWGLSADSKVEGLAGPGDPVK